MTAPDRFKDGYASAERHWKTRWHAANDDLQKAISEIERLRTNLWALQEQDERAEIWREKANRYHARLAAVEADRGRLIDRLTAAKALHTPQPGQGPAYCQDCDEPWPCPTRAVLSAAPTDTTKET